MAGVGGGMGRLLGLGFVFGARDNGAVRTTTGIADGMDRVADSVQEAGRSASSLQRLGNAIAAISVAQLDRIGDSIEGLAERAGIDPSDTGIESFGVEFANTWRRATVGLGPFRDEVESMRGEISGLAYSLDVDANEMISAVTGIARSGNSLEDFGIELRSVAGAIQANILSGEQLAGLLTGLSEGYELGTEGASRLVDRVTAIGEAFGVGADAVRRLPEVISAADPILARFTNLSIEDVTESITRLSVAMTRGLGVSFEEGSQAATELFTTLADARGGLTDLVTGVGSEFPDLATELGIATGDIDESMQSILSDPLTFAHRMRDVMSTMDRTSPAFARLSGALAGLPANFRFLIEGGEEAGAALDAASEPVTNFEGAFNRMARSGAGTARTFSESMQRLSDAFETRLHRMTSITTSEVLGRQRAAYDRLGNYLEDWSGRGGPLGFLTQAFLNVRRYGLVHGLLPMLEDRLRNAFPGLASEIETFAPLLADLGEGFVSVATSMGPMLLIMSQLGAGRVVSSAFSALRGGAASIAGFLGPWGLLVAGIVAGVGAIIYYWDEISTFFESTDWAGLAQDAAQGMMDGLATLLDWSEQAREFIADIDWHAIGEDIGKGVRTAFAIVSSLFEGEFNQDVIDFFTDAFGMPPDQVASMVVTTLRDILQNTVGQLDTIFHDVMAGIFGDDSMWVTVFDTLFAASPLGALDRAIDADNIVDAFINILGVAFGPAGALYAWAYDTLDNLWKDIFGESLQDSFAQIPDILIGLLNTGIEVAMGPLLMFPNRFSEIFRNGGIVGVIEDFIGYVEAELEVLGEIWDEFIVPMGEIAFEVLTEVGSMFAELWTETIAPVLGMLREWWDEEFGGEVMPEAQQNIEGTGDAFRRMWRNQIRPALQSFMRMQADGIRRFREWIPTFQQVARVAIDRFFAIISAVRNFRARFEAARDVLAAGWQLIGARVQRFFVQPILQAGDSFMTIFENIQMSVSSLRLGFLRIIQSLVQGIQTAFNAIPAPLRSAMGLVGDGLEAAVSSINREVTDEETRIREAQAVIRAERDERAATIAAYDASVSSAEAALADVRAEHAARMAREEAELNEERERLIGGVDRMGDRLDASLERAADRMGEIGDTAEGTVITEDDAGSDAPVVARPADEDAGTGAGSDGVAGGETRRRSRARREAADAAEEVTSRERARDIAREMVISAFGPEAARQLASALGGGRGRAGSRARGSSAGGSGEEIGG